MLGNCQSHIDSLLPSVLENIIKKQRNVVYTACYPTEEFRNSFLIFPN